MAEYVISDKMLSFGEEWCWRWCRGVYHDNALPRSGDTMRAVPDRQLATEQDKAVVAIREERRRAARLAAGAAPAPLPLAVVQQEEPSVAEHQAQREQAQDGLQLRPPATPPPLTPAPAGSFGYRKRSRTFAGKSRARRADLPLFFEVARLIWGEHWRVSLCRELHLSYQTPGTWTSGRSRPRSTTTEKLITCLVDFQAVLEAALDALASDRFEPPIERVEEAAELLWGFGFRRRLAHHMGVRPATVAAWFRDRHTADRGLTDAVVRLLQQKAARVRELLQPSMLDRLRGLPARPGDEPEPPLLVSGLVDGRLPRTGPRRRAGAPQSGPAAGVGAGILFEPEGADHGGWYGDHKGGGDGEWEE